MKRQNFVFLQIFALLLSSFFIGSTKEITNLPPALTTTAVANISANSFIRGGTISVYGGLQVLKRGVCLGTSQNPSPFNFKTEEGTGIGSFASLVTCLHPGTNYYLKTYAANSERFLYGGEISISTIEILTIVTFPDSEFVSYTAISGGEITKDMGDPITARGIRWATAPNPQITKYKTVERGRPETITSSITVMDKGATYYLWSYPTKRVGSEYVVQISFLTRGLMPDTFI